MSLFRIHPKLCSAKLSTALHVLKVHQAWKEYCLFVILVVS
jgi:hypothetical protein